MIGQNPWMISTIKIKKSLSPDKQFPCGGSKFGDKDIYEVEDTANPYKQQKLKEVIIYSSVNNQLQRKLTISLKYDNITC